MSAGPARTASPGFPLGVRSCHNSIRRLTRLPLGTCHRADSPRQGPRAGKHFPERGAGARFLPPLNSPPSAMCHCSQRAVGHVLRLGPGSPSLSVTVPAFGNSGSETCIRGLVQREGHPVRSALPPPAAASLSCHLTIIIVTVIVMAPGRVLPDHPGSAFCWWLANFL